MSDKDLQKTENTAATEKFAMLKLLCRVWIFMKQKRLFS